MLFAFCGSSSVRQFQREFAGNFSVTAFSSATLKGLMQKNSGIGHGKVIRHIARTPQRKALFLMLGNADLDFSYYRDFCENMRIDEADFFGSRVTIYNAFLEHILNDDLQAQSIAVIGVLAPQLCPLRDEVFPAAIAAHTGVEEARMREAAAHLDLSHAARIDRTLRFNDLLEARLLRHPKLRLHRIDRMMLDGEGKLAAPFFPAQPREHHAAKAETFRCWRELLAEHVPQYAPRKPAVAA
ncbi:hypothetical protein ACFFMP_18155 [Pseudoroseomonas cervicalis]|uniref:SGNH/GDSL hydrolase family protein n=1 Tax=Pseudoroseomonas cervicalis ATCC 49957 TaxID=525371 RepID=D5RR65_9PROT|nr:hypothetical protein [Pseudoroseomonas cervicalis]EFH10213.1 hypothetical protein HMPREF0731_3577 [Pseudoroseomonas cervicalis ATCC 49957]